MPKSSKDIIAVLGSDSLSWIDLSRYISPKWCGEIVGGGENSIDYCVREWCGGHKIEYISYVPNYKIWGRRYGRQRRDDDILSFVDKLIYFWDNEEDIEIVRKAIEIGIPYRVHIVEER